MLTFLYVYVGRIEQGTFDESKEAYTTWIQMVCHSKFPSTCINNIFAACVPLNESFGNLERNCWCIFQLFLVQILRIYLLIK